MSTTTITHTLFLGDLPQLSGVKRACSVKEAVEIIESGGTAVLPPGAWEMAEETLKQVTTIDTSRTLRYAKTGSLEG